MLSPPWDERTIVSDSLCFFQARLQMLWDSHIFGWPSSWRLLCACCPLLPFASCQWPSGHQKAIRYRKKNRLLLTRECLSQKSEPFSKAIFLQNSELLGELFIGLFLGLLLTPPCKQVPWEWYFYLLIFIIKKEELYIHLPSQLNSYTISILPCIQVGIFFFFSI